MVAPGRRWGQQRRSSPADRRSWIPPPPLPPASAHPTPPPPPAPEVNRRHRRHRRRKDQSRAHRCRRRRPSGRSGSSGFNTVEALAARARRPAVSPAPAGLPPGRSKNRRFRHRRQALRPPAAAAGRYGQHRSKAWRLIEHRDGRGAAAAARAFRRQAATADTARVAGGAPSWQLPSHGNTDRQLIAWSRTTTSVAPSAAPEPPGFSQPPPAPPCRETSMLLTPAGTTKRWTPGTRKGIRGARRKRARRKQQAKHQRQRQAGKGPARAQPRSRSRLGVKLSIDLSVRLHERSPPLAIYGSCAAIVARRCPLETKAVQNKPHKIDVNYL